MTTFCLRCVRCESEYPFAAHFFGCPACTMHGAVAQLEVIYDYDRIASQAQVALADGHHLWDYSPLLPVPPGCEPVTLGEGNTPLVRSCRIGPSVGLKRLYFKNETVNPTWSFKDRYNAVTLSVARALGFRRVVNSSTGNHGASVAAYAARAGMDCIILCPPETSRTQRLQISLYGARLVEMAWDTRMDCMAALARDHGWFPVGLFMPFAVSNPFGVEGYKTFAYELRRQMPKPPGDIFFPAGRGNGLYGSWKGWHELLRFGLVKEVPRHHAVQPEGAASLVRSYVAGKRTAEVVADPHSVATSTRESVGSDLALGAIRSSGGSAIAVSDAEILEAVWLLGQEGLCVEPASAMPAAAVIKLALAERLDPDAEVVCILTSSGIKWPEDLQAVAQHPAVAVSDVRELVPHLAQWGWR